MTIKELLQELDTRDKNELNQGISRDKNELNLKISTL